MLTFLIAFCSSLIATFLLIRYGHIHQHLSGDHDLNSPQKFHSKIVPRVGGIAIALGVCCSSLYVMLKDGNSELIIPLLIACVPVFGIGITEDLLKRVGVRKRLLFSACGALIAVIFIPATISTLNIPGLDKLLALTAISIVFTCFAITGLANGYNIIDGFHGLSSMVAIITLGAILYLAFKLNDLVLFKLTLCMLAAVMGFFIWNYPRGLIFLGDGGAYLIGFWIAILSILLVERHNSVSPWFALAINIYPIFETLFSIYRRLIHQQKNPGDADGIHFHTLIFRRIIKKSSENTLSKDGLNAKTAPYIWILVSMNAVPVILFFDSTIALQTLVVLFSFTYLYLYRSIVLFKTPKWFRLD